MTKEEEQKNLQEIGQILTFMMNNQAIEDFEGYSPAEMQYILYDPFGAESPMQIVENIPDEVLNQIPILNNIEYILKKIEEAGALKLTLTGALPHKLVVDLYGRYFRDEEIEKYGYKLYKEADSMSINISRIILQLAKLAKKAHNRLSLTKKGKTLMKNRKDLFIEIFKTYMQKFRIAYMDGYENDDCAQIGQAFTIILLAKYGNELRQDRFYAKKYQKAFPDIRNKFYDSFGDPDDSMYRCYKYRTFSKFLNFFNFVEIKKASAWDQPNLVKKSAIFDQVFRIIPSNATGKMN